VSLQLQRNSQKVRSYLLLLCVLAVVAGGTPSAPSGSEPPAWAYVVPPPDTKPARDGGKIRRVPNSAAGYTLKEVTDRFAAPDWHPEDHPKMPDVVAHGRKPDVNACGYCHRADGPGGPENASLAGLPYDYILEQMADYKSGKRSTALPKRLPQANMIALAKAATDEEIQVAAKYFSSLKPRQNIRVVETARVPKTYVAGWVMAAKEGKEKEPLGRRIVEMPEDLERFESRDARATFVAYVPIGSLREGETIVRGDRVGPPCATCHGKDLHGRELAPSIAGRSPSYIVRQLYEMQTGARTGSGVMLMKAAVARLSPDEMIDVAAYLASLKP
jgi:cytochrome c553